MSGEEMPPKKKETGFTVPDKPASDDPVDRLIHALSKKTWEFAQANAYWADLKKTEVDERLQRVANRVKKLGGCNYEEFKGLIEDILETTLPAPIIFTEEGRVRFIPFAVVKVLNNPNSHNYPKNTPIMVHRLESEQRGRGMIAEGLEGNYLPEFHKSFVPATLSEITEFVKRLRAGKMGGSHFLKFLTKAEA